MRRSLSPASSTSTKASNGKRKTPGLYASSKSALEIISETARLELQPLGVRVVSVVTSIVESRLQLNQPELKLPSQSQYRAIEGIIAARGRGDDGVVRMETAEYAERVVEDVLAGKSGRIWWGTDAEVVGRGKGAMPVRDFYPFSLFPSCKTVLRC